MAEKLVIIVFENQEWSCIKEWIPDVSQPWTLQTFETCSSLDEFILLNNEEWLWISNWRTNTIDEWEYA